MGKVWLIASGKGGVGKSTLASALGIALSRMERKVCIVDADIGLRDQDAILGVADRVVYDIMDVANRTCLLTQALISPARYPSLTLLPASQFSRVKELEPKAFHRIIHVLRMTNDDVIVDCPAGIERGLRGLLKCDPDDCVLVCTPDDVCIRDAERTGEILSSKALGGQVIVNRLMPSLIRSGNMYTAQTVARTLDLPLLGEVPDDPAVYRALLRHESFMDLDCEARRAVERIAGRMVGRAIAPAAYGTKQPNLFARLFRRRPKEVTSLDS